MNMILGFSALAVTDEDGSLVHNTSSRDIKQWVAGPAEEGGNAVDITDMTIEDFVVQVRQSKPSVKTCATVCSVHKESEVGHAVKLLLRTGYHHMWVVETTDDGNIPVCLLIDFLEFLTRSLGGVDIYNGHFPEICPHALKKLRPGPYMCAVQSVKS
mmetsp:Transcript_24520/g.80362  ORF Transcript_24520/g.80362 Transcript_24520/m.80362 type:complete len:157 (+) Transcript_24520:838-1308(+)